jgi:hypothetical protein
VLAAAAPSVSTLHTHGSFITLALERPAIAELAPDFAAAYGNSISGDNPALRLLIKYLDTVLATDEIAHPDLARSAAAHIIDLASVALGARGDRAEIALGGAKAARLRTIKSDILAILGRNDLSSQMVAGRHGISSAISESCSNGMEHRSPPLSWPSSWPGSGAYCRIGATPI